LPDEENRGSKESGKGLGLEGEPVIAKCPGEMEVGMVEPEMVLIGRGSGGGGIGCFHDVSDRRGFAPRGAAIFIPVRWNPGKI
jgi:hypothetical protein